MLNGVTEYQVATGVLTVLLVAWLIIRVLNSLSIFVYFHSSPRQSDLAHFRCDDCGYNLRGSPIRCPECGKRLPPVKATLVNYLMRIDKLDDLERQRRARGERP